MPQADSAQPTGTSQRYDLAVVITSPPRAGASGQEIFDMVVSGGVFDLSVVVVLDQQGLLHMANDQPPTGQKSLAKLWQSASLFGVERIVVRKTAARQTAVSGSTESIPRSPGMQGVESLSDEELSGVFSQSAQVVVL